MVKTSVPHIVLLYYDDTDCVCVGDINITNTKDFARFSSVKTSASIELKLKLCIVQTDSHGAR